MEDIPYHKLKNLPRRWWCFGRREKEVLSPEVAADRIADAILRLDMKIRNLTYQMGELQLEARALVAEDRVMARAKLGLVKKVKEQHAVLVNFWTNLSQVHMQLENTATIESVADTMGVANSMLSQALGDLGVHKIDDLMFDLQNNSLDVSNLSDALGQPLVEYDIDAELAALEMPEVPQKVVKKTKNSKSLVKMEIL